MKISLLLMANRKKPGKEIPPMASNVSPSGQQLRSALDASETDELLGKVYDHGVMKQVFGYLRNVRWHLIIGGVGIGLRTAANLVTPLPVSTMLCLLSGIISLPIRLTD